VVHIKDIIDKCKQFQIHLFLSYHLPKEIINDNLICYNLSCCNFKYLMRKADIILCTGGIETICEAIYYRKKVLMIPSKNHFEQFTNCQLFSSNISTIKTTDDFSDTNKICDKLIKLSKLKIDDKLYDDIHDYYFSCNFGEILCSELRDTKLTN